MEISLDQFEYIAALKPMSSSAAPAGAAGLETVVSLEEFEQFRSSRGAVGYTLLTRADVSVYVVYLQRLSEKNTTWRHVKMLNTVIKRLQSKPVKLEYRKLGPETYFLVFSDAAFKKEEDTGHALKGTLILRLSKSVPAGAHVQHNKSTGVAEFVMTGTWTCHLIDFVTKRVSNVTRSTFSAELFSICDAGDHAMILRQIVHEFEHGPLTADNARALTEGTLKSTVHIELALDAMSCLLYTSPSPRD